MAYSLFRAFAATGKDKRSPARCEARRDAARCEWAAADPPGSVKHFSPAAHKYQRVLSPLRSFLPSFQRRSSSGPTERGDTKGIARDLKRDSSPTAFLDGDSIQASSQEKSSRSYPRA